MTRPKPWDNEQSAADLVAQLIGGTPTVRDGHGAPPSTHDFDVVLADGRVIALEVTQEVVPAVLAQRSTEAKLEWSFDRLDSEWVVDVREPADARALNAEIEDILALLEASGVDSLLVGRDEIPSEIGPPLGRLGIRLLHRLGPSSPGRVIIGGASVAGSTSPSLVAAVVADHSSRADNVKKLSKADSADERHLFIWIHADRHPVIAAMSFSDVPAEHPSLPARIDVVWIASAFERPSVWRYDRSGWHIITPTDDDDPTEIDHLPFGTC